MTDSSVTITSVATEAASVASTVMQFEPMIASMITPFFPPIAAAQPIIVMAMPFLIKALNDIASNNGGDMLGAFLQLAQHLSAGQPNSPILSPPLPQGS